MTPSFPRIEVSGHTGAVHLGLKAGRGRPAKYLLSGIARCAVCGATMRSNKERQSEARVYECSGSPEHGGFHASIRQDHLDSLVVDAILSRVEADGFTTPRAIQEDSDGSERRLLKLSIKRDHAWLRTVEKEAIKRGYPETLIGQQRIVLPKIAAAERRIADLDAPDPLVSHLERQEHLRAAWDALPVVSQRHIVRLLVTPRIAPVATSERGRRGLSMDRVQLDWRQQKYP